MEKALKIAVGSCRRLHKEVGLYEKECVAQEARIAQLRGAGADEHSVRKQEQVLEESQRMVPDTQLRLQQALAHLRSLVDQAVAAPDDSVRLTAAFAEAEDTLAQLRP